MIVQNQARFMQQPADEGGFAVIDGAAGDEAQQRQRWCFGVHQKYPSRFLRSMEAAAS